MEDNREDNRFSDDSWQFWQFTDEDEPEDEPTEESEEQGSEETNP